MPVLWQVIRRGGYDCANALLDDAKKKGIAVTFRERGRDLLSWAIKNDTHEAVEFIVEKLGEKCASLEETRRLLAKHLHTIGERRPTLLVDLLKKDKFTVEYDRFPVRRAVFDIGGGKRTKMIEKDKSANVNNWAVLSSSYGKDSWDKHDDEQAPQAEVGDSLEPPQIDAIAKLFCVSHAAPQGRRKPIPSPSSRQLDIIPSSQRQQHLCIYLHKKNLPVEVFQSETLQCLIDYWFDKHRPVYQKAVIADGAAAVAFTIFSLLYGSQDEVRVLHPHDLSIALICLTCVMHTAATICHPSLLRQETA